MSSPYGGDRGGGRKSSRKPGAQAGNVNRRASRLLPRARDTEDRRAFLDALEEAQQMTAEEQARTLRNLGFARIVSLAELVGVEKILKALDTIDGHRLAEDKLSGRDRAARREALLNGALGEIWKAVGQCEHCAALVDQLLTGLQLALLQVGGGSDGKQWMDRQNEGSRE
jgi:hypothetical protein